MDQGKAEKVRELLRRYLQPEAEDPKLKLMHGIVQAKNEGYHPRLIETVLTGLGEELEVGEQMSGWIADAIRNHLYREDNARYHPPASARAATG